jgi:hypothetical protein
MSIYNPGPPALGDVGAYQVSSKPFFKGGLSADATLRVIEFPAVTNWIHIRNHTVSDRTADGPRISFSGNGMSTNNYFDFLATNAEQDTNSITLYVKVSKLYYKQSQSGGTTFDVIAGLTNIPTSSIPNNWSGSAGIG